MRYMGSKRRIAKYILPIILANRQEGQWYVEPFCGGCNTLIHVPNPRLASDKCEYLIEMFRAAEAGWRPPEYVSNEEYNFVNKNLNINKILTGYVKHFLSFGGRWDGGYARALRGTDINQIPIETYRKAIQEFSLLSDCIFKHCDYYQLDLPPNSIIYCDPPYKGTKKYRFKFDYDAFWQWCRDKHKEGHTIFISEYNAPDDFVCVWEKEQKCNINNIGATTRTKISIERLFTLKGE